MSVSSHLADIENCLDTLYHGGVILFPTDTIWGIGCDAANGKAVAKVLEIKNRSSAQGLIILLGEVADLSRYVETPSDAVLQSIQHQTKPTTIIYNGGKNIAANVLPEEKTLAIRIVQDDFCKELIRRFGKPIVSTSANIHGHPTPQKFSEIEDAIRNGVDYIVQHRQEDETLSRPSSILKIKPDGFEVIRL